MGKKILELLVFLFISLVILKVINSNLFSTPCVLWLRRTDSKPTAMIYATNSTAASALAVTQTYRKYKVPMGGHNSPFSQVN